MEIRKLSVEDAPADTEAVCHELCRAGLRFRTRRVEARHAGRQQRTHGPPPGAILSGPGLPAFDGFTAWTVAREEYPGLVSLFDTRELLELRFRKHLAGSSHPGCGPGACEFFSRIN